MDKQQYQVGDRVEKLCLVCGEERGHIVALLNSRGLISRVNCPKCGTRSTFKRADEVSGKSKIGSGEGIPYEWTRLYRKGQIILHPTFGQGEVTALIEPLKMDVLFADRVRRLGHGREAELK